MKRIHPLTGSVLALILAGCSLSPSSPTPTATIIYPSTENTKTASTPLPPAEPIPTAPPYVSIAAGDKALSNGDFILARDEFRHAYTASGAPETRAAALWGLARVEFESGNHAQVLFLLQELIYYYPDSQKSANAYFLMAETQMALERYQDAADNYAHYLSLRQGVIDTYIQEWMGDALSSAGNEAAAAAAFQEALNAPHLGDAFLLEIKLADAKGRSGDVTGAQALYDDIASRSENAYINAQVDLQAGQLHLAQLEYDQAYAHFLHAVENYPEAYDSYTALVILVNANYPVDEYQRGLVDYYAGEYGYALAAFDRYIANNPLNDGSAHYYRAMVLRAQDEPEAAVDAWTTFINGYAENSLWLDGWEDKAYTQAAYLGRYDSAAQTLIDFVALVPTSASAPYELLVAGRYLETAGRLEDAALTWERIAQEYPNSSHVSQALFWSGITRYRQYRFDEALSAFQRSLLFSSTPEDKARAQFWIGKSQLSLGQAAEAQTSLQQAAASDPTGYYSERARDTLFDRPPFDPPPAYDLNFDLVAEQMEAEAWIRLTFNLPAETDLGHLGALAQDSRLVRGTELWRLGLLEEARLEFENLRQAISQDPADSYRLANYLLDLGVYRVAIFAARQVLTLAGLDTQSQSLAAPDYFNHVRYGPYYQDLILPAAQQNGLDPLLLFSVLRLESLFEGFVRSPAGARGLMQIMPLTGEEIASDSGWPPDFKIDDLYRPFVSIQLGSYRLKEDYLYFNGDLYATLAGYNAGENMIPVWKPLSNNDPDLFVEVVRFQETRNYLRGIYENYVIYRSLYGTLPG